MRGRMSVRVRLEPGEGIDRSAIEMDLEVKMRSGRMPGAADLPEFLGHRDLLADCDLDRSGEHMGVNALHLLAIDVVVDNHVIAKTGVICGEGDGAVSNRADGCARARDEVNTLMEG